MKRNAQSCQAGPAPQLSRLRPLVPLLACALLIMSAWGCGVLQVICPPEPLPPPIPRDEVEAKLVNEYGRIETLKDMGGSLESEYGPPDDRDSGPDLGVDLAFDATLPGLWLHAEKMGQAVFTLRAKEHRFWLTIPDTKELVTGTRVAFGKLPQLVDPEELSLALGTPQQLGITREATKMEVDGEFYRFDVYHGSYIARQIYVSRREIEIRRIVEYDPSGRKRTIVRMTDYYDVSDIPVPHTFSIERPANQWQVTLELSDPDVNTLPAERMRKLFEPKDRSGWRRVNLDIQPLSDVKAFSEEDD